MAEVKSLKIADRPVNQEAIDLVEETLAMVKAGKVTTIAIVEVHPAGTVVFKTSRTDQYHALNSGCARLAAYLATAPTDD